MNICPVFEWEYDSLFDTSIVQVVPHAAVGWVDIDGTLADTSGGLTVGHEHLQRVINDQSLGDPANLDDRDPSSGW